LGPLVNDRKQETLVVGGFYHDGRHARKLKTAEGNENFVNRLFVIDEKKGACSNEHAPGVYLRDIRSRELD